MLIKSFGTEGQPVLILIHGGGLSWWSWKRHIALLEKAYKIDAVIIDGHGEDSANDFVSIEDTANKLKKYISDTYGGSVHGICGLSIGAQIAVDLLIREPDLSENWLIESALVKSMGGMLKWLEPTLAWVYPMIQQKWYAKLQAKSLCLQQEDFDLYFEDSKKMSLASLKAITRSNGTYELKGTPVIGSGRVQIFVGSKEPKIMVESAKILASAITGSELTILEGNSHGAFSLMQVEDYVAVVRQFKNRK